MCSFNSIFNAATGHDIETPRQLRELVGIAHLPPCQDPEDEDFCLCSVDVADVLDAAGIAWEADEGLGFVINHSTNERPLE
jgi:hypothetical protein